MALVAAPRIVDQPVVLQFAGPAATMPLVAPPAIGTTAMSTVGLRITQAMRITGVVITAVPTMAPIILVATTASPSPPPRFTAVVQSRPARRQVWRLEPRLRPQ